MSTIIESIEQRQLKRVPRFAAGRPGARALPGRRGDAAADAGVRGRGDRSPAAPAPTRPSRSASSPSGSGSSRRSRSLPEDRAARGRRARRRPAGEALLPPRAGRQAARVAERRWGIEDDLVLHRGGGDRGRRLRGRRPERGRARGVDAEEEEARGGGDEAADETVGKRRGRRNRRRGGSGWRRLIRGIRGRGRGFRG